MLASKGLSKIEEKTARSSIKENLGKRRTELGTKEVITGGKGDKTREAPESKVNLGGAQIVL